MEIYPRRIVLFGRDRERWLVLSAPAPRVGGVCWNRSRRGCLPGIGDRLLQVKHRLPSSGGGQPGRVRNRCVMYSRFLLDHQTGGVGKAMENLENLTRADGNSRTGIVKLSGAAVQGQQAVG